VITQDFVHGADYAALKEAGVTFKGLLGAEAIVRRGEGRAAEGAEGQRLPRRDGLADGPGRKRRRPPALQGPGEMNPSQLWETTMDPTVRRLLRVQIDDAIEADRVFTMLMATRSSRGASSSRATRCGRRISTCNVASTFRTGMPVSLANLISADAVQAALDEFGGLGQRAFLKKYGFGKSRDFVVRNPKTGAWADSKAIAGVALAYQLPAEGVLRASEFSVVKPTVAPKASVLWASKSAGISDIVGQDWTPTK